jgi:MFS family permease
VSFATCIWQGVTNSWPHLFIARFFLGLGVGPKSATVPVYAAECAPAKIRGALVMQWQVSRLYVLAIIRKVANDLNFFFVSIGLDSVRYYAWLYRRSRSLLCAGQ